MNNKEKESDNSEYKDISPDDYDDDDQLWENLKYIK